MAESKMRSTLPASWFREPAFFELERRAIFLKTWMLVSNRVQYVKTGQYVCYSIAGYEFFIVQNQEGELRAFLNYCPSCLSPLVQYGEGTATSFTCSREGHQYGLDGQPTRSAIAAHSNINSPSLWKVHLHVDKTLFIWINFDSSESPTVSWESEFGGVDTQERLSWFKPQDYTFDHYWDFIGDFNWKTLVENYNECYHCSTAHPGIAPSITKETKFSFIRDKNFIKHGGEDIDQDPALVPFPTFSFPNASTTLSSTFYYMMSVAPVSATRTRMRFEFYRSKHASDEEFNSVVGFFKQVENEDKWLGSGAQRNLNSDTYVAGPLHPEMEVAVTYFESLLRPLLVQHAKEEKSAGHDICLAREIKLGAPALRSLQLDNANSSVATDNRTSIAV